ncbi:MAG: DUF348 domain-containing protein [Candidatus Promineofilum sp.]|nr:DUF348 domain-containing protein [Promineifilum sp.]
MTGILPLLSHHKSLIHILILMLLIGVVACRPAEVTYTIVDGGTRIPVTGRYQTVGEVLAAGGPVLAADDVVLPERDVAADPTTPIVIDRAAEVMVLDQDSVTIYRTQQPTLGGFLAEAGLDVPPGARLLADGQQVSQDAVGQLPLPGRIIFDPYKRVIITDGGERWALRTTARTVGEALVESGVVLGALDVVEPPREAPLTPEMGITIERAAPYVVAADGQTVDVSSDSTIVFEILADNGIALGPLDYTRPAADAAVVPGDAIEVVRVAERIDTEDTAVPFETVYEAAADLPIDTLVEASPGSNGTLQRRTRVRLENGLEVSRTPDGEGLIVAPVNRVLRYGTQIVMRTIDTPSGPVEYWRVVNMRVTSYTATSAGKNPGEPGYGITASGMQAGTGVIAVDPTVIPFRSYVYVPGYGVAFAGDTGGGIKGRFIDLGYDEGTFQSWRGTVDVYYLGPPPPAEDIRWILP